MSFGKKFSVGLLFVCLSARVVFGSEPIDFEGIFGGTEGGFVLYDMKHDSYVRHNEARCSTRFTPASTFKIPNALIALETGIASDSDFVIKWDSLRDPRQEWWTGFFEVWAQDHTLKSAIKYSVVWYFRELARRIGKENYEKYLKQFDYGNQDISGGVDKFWLSSSLKISPDEQVAFLKKLYKNQLGISQRSADILKQMIVLEEGEGYRWSGKTGGGDLPDGKAIGWLVGFLETKDNVWVYALNIEDESFEKMAPKRLAIAKKLFEGLGLLKGKDSSTQDSR